MKLFGENRDRAIDILLRAQVLRSSGVLETCSEFDPDLASAYVEGRLTTGLHSRYEEHLSVCGTCRKCVVGLSRIAMSDLKPARTSGVKVRGVFGILSRPQWALAVAAIIVFVVSLPLLLSRSPNKSSKRTSVAEQVASDSAPTAPPRANESNQVSKTSAAKSQEERNDKSAPAASRKRAISPTGPREQLEARGDSESTDEVKQKSESQAASQVAAAAAQESQEAKSDADRGRQQQKDSAQSGESKGHSQESAGTEKARLAEATPAPPPAPRAKSLKPPAGKLSLRDNAASESVRPSERKIHNKLFLWKDGAWTDKKFAPDKGLPVVTIIRASNVYNEVLTKHAGLKRYLDVLPETERAIIVYEGTVYKLIPQQN